MAKIYHLTKRRDPTTIWKKNADCRGGGNKLLTIHQNKSFFNRTVWRLAFLRVVASAGESWLYKCEAALCANNDITLFKHRERSQCVATSWQFREVLAILAAGVFRQGRCNGFTCIYTLSQLLHRWLQWRHSLSDKFEFYRKWPLETVAHLHTQAKR